MDSYSHRTGEYGLHLGGPDLSDMLFDLAHEVAGLKFRLGHSLNLTLCDSHLNHKLLLVETLLDVKDWTSGVVYPLLEEGVKLVVTKFLTCPHKIICG